MDGISIFTIFALLGLALKNVRSSHYFPTSWLANGDDARSKWQMYVAEYED
jgi:hypothetical protein